MARISQRPRRRLGWRLPGAGVEVRQLRSPVGRQLDSVHGRNGLAHRAHPASEVWALRNRLQQSQSAGDPGTTTHGRHVYDPLPDVRPQPRRSACRYRPAHRVARHNRPPCPPVRRRRHRSASSGLRVIAHSLLTSAGETLIPDLFHELLAVWRRRAVSLAAPPGTGVQEALRLKLGLDEPENSTGWALTDTLAAASWGIPIVARDDHPPDFYVPAESALRAARSLLGHAADPAARACTVAVAPVRLACLRRVDHSQTSGEGWPVANHIVVALDIAQDRARGLEALQQWNPEGIVRAW